MAWTMVMLVFPSIFVVFITAQSVEALTNTKICYLTLNGYDDIEPEGDPLLLHVRFKVLRLRDIPDSGGSFSVNIM